MTTTVQALILDAKHLVSRLSKHDNSADGVLSQAQTLSNHIQAVKRYHQEIEGLNSLANQRPRSALVLNIQQENRHIRELQLENRELRVMLEEHQSALELIMNKYRQQIKKLAQTRQAEKEWISRDNLQEVQRRIDKVEEMVAIMQKATEVDEKNYVEEQKKIEQLMNQNKLLREFLEIGKSSQPNFARKVCIERTDEAVQTDL